jgi:hypothetical protein
MFSLLAAGTTMKFVVQPVLEEGKERLQKNPLKKDEFI